MLRSLVLAGAAVALAACASPDVTAPAADAVQFAAGTAAAADKPATPVIVSVVTSTGRADITWRSVTGSGYQVVSCGATELATVRTLTAADTILALTGLVEGLAYGIKVRVWHAAGTPNNGRFSPCATFTGVGAPPPPPPPAPVTGTFLMMQVMPTCCEQLGVFHLPSGTGFTAVPQNSGQGDLSPDRTTIVYWRPFDNRIFRANVDGTGETVIASGAINYVPRWNAAGTKIAFTREVGGGMPAREIFTMNPDGSALTRLTSNGWADEFPHWSPDGTRIVFASHRDGNAEIYVMNSDGTNQVRLTSSPGLDHGPSWSPDGSRIAFISERTGVSEVFTMAPDGTSLTQLTVASEQVPSWPVPAWSPDGSRIAYQRTISGVSSVWTMRADGTDARLLRTAPTGVVWEHVASWRAP